MGCVTATAKRRRKQAVNGYRHMDPKRRPHYPTHTVAIYEKRAAQAAEKRQAMQSRKRKNKKG